MSMGGAHARSQNEMPFALIREERRWLSFCRVSVADAREDVTDSQDLCAPDIDRGRLQTAAVEHDSDSS
jgi:hypothetical protein